MPRRVAGGVDVRRSARPPGSACARWSEREPVLARRERSRRAIRERRLQLREAFERGLGPRVLVACRAHVLPSQVARTGNRLLLEAALLDRRAGAFCWLSQAKRSTSSRVKPSIVAIRSAEMPCGTIGKRSRRSWLLPSDPPPSEPIGTRDMRLDAAADDQVLHAARDAHGGEVDGLQARAAEAVSVTPVTSSGQPAASTALRAMHAPCSPDLLNAAHDDVLDVCRVERGASQRRSAPAPAAPGDGRRGAHPLLAAPARGADGIDDVGDSHVECAFLS